jgi:ankyrin repeat protein
MIRRVVFCLLAVVLGIAATKNEATSRLLAAAADGDGDKIIAALAAGADPNARSDTKTPALFTVSTKALFGREKQVIAAFVKAKADVNAADEDGDTPLMAAAATDRGEILELLIAAGAKIEAKDKDGWTAVHYAVTNGNGSVLDKLIAAKANVNAVAKDKYSALMMALASGRGGIAEKLMKAGAKYPTSWPDGLSGVIHATAGRDLAAVRIALANNPKIDDRAPDDGFTALALASWNGDAQIVMELLRAGADPSIKDKEGKTPLDQATHQQEPEIVALLGGTWDKPHPKGGKTISIPCQSLGGTVESNLAVEGKALVFTTTFPHPVSYYLGGGNMNRAETAKKFTYDGSFAPAYYLDTDSNAKTGRKAEMFEKEAEGAEYTVEYSQYGTSVMLHYTNSKGEERRKQVYANVLDVSLKKGKDDVDLSDLGDDIPRAENDKGVLRSRFPLKMMALKPGSSIRVTAKIGACNPVVEKVTLR